MKYKIIALLGAFFLTVSLATAQQGQSENYTSQNYLEDYYWEFSDQGDYETEAELRNNTHSEALTYEIVTRVNEGELETSTVLLTGLTPGEDGFNSAFSVDPANPEPDEEVIFNGSHSEGDIIEYNWDINGDGNTDYYGETATHTYTEEGTYQATLTVVNTFGDTQTATTNISVDQTSESSGSRSSSSSSSGANPNSIEQNNITMDQLPNQVTVEDPVTISGTVLGVEEESAVLIYVDDELKANTTTSSDGEFAEELTISSLGQKQITAISEDQESSDTVNVVPLLSISDIQSPTEVDQHQNFNICVEAEAKPEDPTITIQKDDNILNEETTSETCFEMYEETPNDHEYTIKAALGGEEIEEQTSVNVNSAPSETNSENSGLTGNFFEENSSLLLSGLGVIALLGFMLRRKYAS